MMLRVLSFVLLVVLAVSVPGSAQVLGTGVLEVVEIGPTAFMSKVTAIQSTISAVEDVVQSAYQLLELTPLDDIALSTEFLETMALLGEIAVEGQMLMQDIEAAAANFEALFGLEVLPSTPAALQLKVNDTVAYIWKARRYAVCTQSLIAHIAGAVTHVRRLVELLGALSGNMAGNQVQIQLLAQANQTLQTQTLQQAAEQHVKILEGAQREVIVRGWNKMQADRWVGWPTLAEGGN